VIFVFDGSSASRSAAVALVALVGALAGGAAAGTSPAADLVESKVAVSQRTVQQGGRLRVSDTVANRGSSDAAPSRTRIYLGRSRTHRPRDRLLGARLVRRLQPGAISRHSTVLRVPRSAPLGSFRVIACADGRHLVREASEKNNCRASTTITVVPIGDRRAPTFAGLKSATTCIPGPIRPDSTASYRLVWDTAVDDVTPASEIRYDIYEATQPGDEVFSQPTYTTEPGATFFATPRLSGLQTFYFVVRARDRAGNRDANEVERQGVNLCA